MASSPAIRRRKSPEYGPPRARTDGEVSPWRLRLSRRSCRV
ncbi:hypothetical protein ACP70R_000759 [Stipagrostis hirtigluma subsp. patula]